MHALLVGGMGGPQGFKTCKARVGIQAKTRLGRLGHQPKGDPLTEPLKVNVEAVQRRSPWRGQVEGTQKKAPIDFRRKDEDVVEGSRWEQGMLSATKPCLCQAPATPRYCMAPPWSVGCYSIGSWAQGLEKTQCKGLRHETKA